MKRFPGILLVLVISIALQGCYGGPSSSYKKVEEEHEWTAFKAKFAKAYKNDTENIRRREIFLGNKKMIEEHNEKYRRGETSFYMKLNSFSDMSKEEVNAMMNGYKKRPKSAQHNALKSQFKSDQFPEAPASFDWRDHGAVTAVKNQAQCGSCWAFSTVGALESQYFIKTGNLVSMSEQNLVDCSTDYGNDGCDGGMMEAANQYIADNGGIDTEESYPYEEKDGRCRYTDTNKAASTQGFINLPYKDEDALVKAIAFVGPISVSMNAGNPSFHHYTGGVYYEPKCDPDTLDHGVLAVGYGATENGTYYWIIKNSWGTDWVPAAVALSSITLREEPMGGRPSREREFPWAASLQKKDGFHICMATVMSELLVITLTSCVTRSTSAEITIIDPSSVRIFAGNVRLNDVDTVNFERGVFKRINDIFVRSNSDNELLTHAVIQITSPFRFTKFIRPVELWSSDDRRLRDGTDFIANQQMTCHIVGWTFDRHETADTVSYTIEMSRVLRVVDVYLLTKDDCTNVTCGSNYTVTTNQTVSNETDTCQSDFETQGILCARIMGYAQFCQGDVAGSLTCQKYLWGLYMEGQNCDDPSDIVTVLRMDRVVNFYQEILESKGKSNKSPKMTINSDQCLLLVIFCLYRAINR